VRSESGSTGLVLNFRGSEYEFEVPFIDRASLENAITVAVASLYLEISDDVIAKGLKGLAPVAMRMNRKAGLNNCLLIEDYYNSDPGSLAIAVEYLAMQNKRIKTLILSDFLQSGRDEKELYGEIAELIERSGVDKLIGIGEALLRNRQLFSEGARFYSSTDEFIRMMTASDFKDEAVLLKGARIFEFERIGVLLEEKIHQTVLEVNLDAVSSNLGEFRKHLNPGTGIMAMVKAFAYGAGPAEIASLLQYHRINYLAVAYADEGIELRNAGVTLPLMVMNPDPGSSELIIRHNLEPEIFSFSSLKTFSDASVRQGVLDYPVHIKIDTGMHRLGFLPAEVEALAVILKGTPSLRVRSVLSHLAASEDAGKDEFTHRQVELFLGLTEKLKSELGYTFIRHILNSAGIFRFPSYQFEMVRPGIAIYGIGTYKGINLRPAGRFITRISQVKKVPANEPVGYGCSDVSGDDRVIAILPVGYADGLSRRLGNRNGSLYIRGRRVALVGNICMDMCMADVSGTDAREGDEAEIFGENIRIEEVAARCETIPYEILTSIPGRVKRVFFRE
jgi:alanine racemase